MQYPFVIIRKLKKVLKLSELLLEKQERIVSCLEML